jgi:F plasmid transfer operon, TraF, protein
VAGFEYGNIDEFFSLIDNVSNDHKPTQPPTPGNPIHGPGSGINVGDIIEICCPNLNELVSEIKQEVTNRVALLGLIRVDAYAKAFDSLDLPVLFGKEAAGGAWTMGINWSRTWKSYSFVDSTIAFDTNAALADLTAQYKLMPGDPETVFDIAGDVDVIIDPSTGLARIVYDNDSALVTKAARTNEISVGYGRQLIADGERGVFVGAKLSYYDPQLSRVITRFGDITDTKRSSIALGG